MSPSPSPDERRLVFEARRLTIEALVKIYLEQVSSSRNLVTVYLRLMFTLSLGALAGVITLYGTMLRFGTSASISMITPLEVVLAIAALAALVTSALLSARALQKSAFDVAPLLHNPFPSADSVIDSIFDADDIDERQILRKLYFALDKTVEHQPPLRLSTRLITLFLIGGLFGVWGATEQKVHLSPAPARKPLWRLVSSGKPSFCRTLAGTDARPSKRMKSSAEKSFSKTKSG